MHAIEAFLDAVAIFGLEQLDWKLDRDGMLLPDISHVGRALDQMPSLGLAKLPNVIATPHIGGLTPPAIESQSLETVRQVKQIVGGEVPVGAVNASTWARRP